MRLVTFAISTPLGKVQRIGALEEQNVIDLNLSYQGFLRAEGEERARELADVLVPPDVVTFIKGGWRCLDAAKQAVDYAMNKGATVSTGEKIIHNLAEIKLLPPLRPGKIFALSVNFADHVSEQVGISLPIPEFPVAFVKSSSAVIGPDDPIIYPKITEQLDYEIEVAAVIGKRGKDIPKEAWQDHVYGYTILNDISAREVQFKEMEKKMINIGKNLDTFTPVGPCIATADEVPDPNNLDMELRVNGQVRQKSNTKYMVYKFSDAIAYFSRDLTLEPGDMISSGTPSGVAVFRKPDPKPFYLKPGDVIEAYVEKIGVLRNSVLG